MMNKHLQYDCKLEQCCQEYRASLVNYYETRQHCFLNGIELEAPPRLPNVSMTSE